MINKLRTHVSSIVAFFGALTIHYRFLRENCRAQSNRPIAYLSLKHNILRRYMYPLVMALLRDYDVRIALSFSLVSRLVDSERMLLATPGVRFVWRRPGDAAVALHQNNVSSKRCPVVVVNRDYFNRFKDTAPHIMHFPFPMYPLLYRHDFRCGDAGLTGRMRIFFAGNVDPHIYDDPSITGRFGLLSRYHLYTVLKDRLSDVMLQPQSFDELKQLLADGNCVKKVVFVDTSAFSIPPEQLFSVLDHADIYLALPGTKVPHCHNCIEALSRGCIPMLQYGDLFPLPLVDNVNSIAYASVDSFVCAVRKALSIDAVDVARLSRGAKEYYRTTLSHESFMTTFNEKIGRYRELELIINAERRSL